jgi:hypothetical protein
MVDVTVIVEMDNARRTGIEAATAALGELVRQITALPRRFEVLVIHDPSLMPHAAVDEVIGGSGARAAANVVDVTVVAAAPGQRYYELKNLGAERARGEILLFCDGDTIAEPGFVSRLLGAIDDPRVQVVTGTCYVSPTRTLLEKAMALLWQFEVRRDDDELRPGERFYAHSLTIRRALFREHPFRPDGRLRGACQDLRAELNAAGIATWQHVGARVRHPPPAGVSGILRRALWDGHDLCVDRRRLGQPMAGPSRAARGFAASLRRAWGRIDAGRAAVGARTVELPAIVAVAVVWHLAVRAGYVATRAAPRLIPTLLPP